MLTGACLCGQTGWTFATIPESVTACSCTACRRYGVLWIYDHEGEGITLTGPTVAYTRVERTDPALEFHFCGSCGCVVAWRGRTLQADGRRRMAVNLRLTEPGPVAHLPIDHFDGLDSFEDLPRDGRCVAHMWF